VVRGSCVKCEVSLWQRRCVKPDHMQGVWAERWCQSGGEAARRGVPRQGHDGRSIAPARQRPSRRYIARTPPWAFSTCGERSRTIRAHGLTPSYTLARLRREVVLLRRIRLPDARPQALPPAALRRRPGATRAASQRGCGTLHRRLAALAPPLEIHNLSPYLQVGRSPGRFEYGRIARIIHECALHGGSSSRFHGGGLRWGWPGAAATGPPSPDPSSHQGRGLPSAAGNHREHASGGRVKHCVPPNLSSGTPAFPFSTHKC
jgi:hypothetical protein